MVGLSIGSIVLIVNLIIMEEAINLAQEFTKFLHPHASRTVFALAHAV